MNNENLQIQDLLKKLKGERSKLYAREKKKAEEEKLLNQNITKYKKELLEAIVKLQCEDYSDIKQLLEIITELEKLSSYLLGNEDKEENKTISQKRSEFKQKLFEIIATLICEEFPELEENKGRLQAKLGFAYKDYRNNPPRSDENIKQWAIRILRIENEIELTWEGNEVKGCNLELSTSETTRLARWSRRFIEDCQKKLPKPEGEKEAKTVERNLVRLKVMATVQRHFDEVLESLHSHEAFEKTLKGLISEDKEMEIGEDNVEIKTDGKTDALLEGIDEALTSLAKELELDEKRVKVKGYHILWRIIKKISFTGDRLKILGTDLEKEDAITTLKELLIEKSGGIGNTTTSDPENSKEIEETTKYVTDGEATGSSELKEIKVYEFKDTLADKIETTKNEFIERFITSVIAKEKKKTQLRKTINGLLDKHILNPDLSFKKLESGKLSDLEVAKWLIEELKAEGEEMEIIIVNKNIHVIFTDPSNNKVKTTFKTLKLKLKLKRGNKEGLRMKALVFGKFSETQNGRTGSTQKRKKGRKNVPGIFKMNSKKIG